MILAPSCFSRQAASKYVSYDPYRWNLKVDLGSYDLMTLWPHHITHHFEAFWRDKLNGTIPEAVSHSSKKLLTKTYLWFWWRHVTYTKVTGWQLPKVKVNHSTFVIINCQMNHNYQSKRLFRFENSGYDAFVVIGPWHDLENKVISQDSKVTDTWNFQSTSRKDGEAAMPKIKALSLKAQRAASEKLSGGGGGNHPPPCAGEG